MSPKKPQSDDFREEDYLQRTKTLEESCKELDFNFNDRVHKAVSGRTDIQKEIKYLIWQTVKDKIIWFIGGTIIMLFGIFAKEFLSQLASAALSQVGK